MKLNRSVKQFIFSSFPIDGLLITNLNNIRYVSDFSGSSAFILICKNKNYFITDFRYKSQSLKEVNGNFTFIFYKSSVINEIIKIIKSEKIKYLGIETQYTYYQFVTDIINQTKSKIIDCSKGLINLRSIKSENEIKYIKKSLLIAEKSFQRIKNLIKPGIKEKDIAIELEYKMKNFGAEDISFPTIVASGIRAALPHGSPTNKKIRNNELIIIDFGARFKGYHSDTTYTMDLNNKNRRLKKAYKTVLECLELAKSLIKPGNEIKNVAEKIDQYIIDNGFKDGLIHSLGHGVGLDVHELPVISKTQSEIFKEGMVFTIEPGIYIEGIGGVREEKIAYLNKKGLQILNTY